MQDSPLNLREDVTVSLDRELIEKIVGIAEIRGTTLSALVRDILGAFCRAYRSGSDWTRSFDQASAAKIPPGTGMQPGGQDQMTLVLSRLANHDAVIAALEERISLLELTDGVPGPRVQNTVAIHQPGPVALQTTFSPDPGKIAPVFDCDAPVAGDISDEALVKVRRPASPIITSIDINTIGRINQDQDYSLTEAAALLSISTSTIRKYTKEGRLNSRKIGRSSVFKGRDLLAYLERKH